MTYVSKPAERRRYPRTQIHLPVQAIRLDPDGDDVVDSLEMIDISRGGIGAVCRRSYYPGQRVLLRLPSPGLGVRNVCATVLRCAKTLDEYQVGFEFEQPLLSLCADADLAAEPMAA